jgi:hypothetical protein
MYERGAEAYHVSQINLSLQTATCVMKQNHIWNNTAHESVWHYGKI